MNIIEIYKRFNTQAKCIRYLELLRWGNMVKCSYCSSTRITSVKKESRHHCNACKRSFSVLVGTIFEDTNMELPKWFVAIGLILNAKKGLSSRQLARDIEVNRNTAWYMQMRIRKAMNEHDLILSGIVEIDETYMGGKLANKTKKYRMEQKASGKVITGMEHRKAILGILQRQGKVIASPLEKANGENIKPIIEKTVDKEAVILTDGFGAYAGLNKKYKDHQIVNHEKDEFVRGNYHTNSIEGFWSIVKRAIIGQYHRISEKYLNLYLDECSYKFNNKGDGNLFENFLKGGLGLNTT